MTVVEEEELFHELEVGIAVVRLVMVELQVLPLDHHLDRLGYRAGLLGAHWWDGGKGEWGEGDGRARQDLVDLLRIRQIQTKSSGGRGRLVKSVQSTSILYAPRNSLTFNFCPPPLDISF